MMTEDFDDLGLYRRKVEKLEQTIATMALEIGVLKQELESEIKILKSRVFDIEETLRSEDIMPYGN